MPKPTNHLTIAVLCFTAVTIFSCSSVTDIPFPENDLSFSQPVTVPLKFTETKKLAWDITNRRILNPVVKQLDIDALPTSEFDSTGFKPFTAAPEETKIDFSQLPFTSFSLDKLPSKPLPFKTIILPPPQKSKTSVPSELKGNPLLISELGQPQGLPDRLVLSLLKDREGLMWIGCGNSLCRYDGEYLKTFISDPNLLPLGMVEEDDGSIWMVCPEGIKVFNPKMGTLSSANICNAQIRNVSRIIKDKKGRLWFTRNQENTVIVIDPVTQSYKIIDKSAGLSGGNPSDVAEDDKGNIWISNDASGINIINPEKGTIQYLAQTNGLLSNSYLSVVKDLNGKIWAATDKGELESFDTDKNTISHYRNATARLINTLTLLLNCDAKGKIWMNKILGLDIVDPVKGVSRHIDQSRGLFADVATGIVMDNFNRVWVGTTQGVDIISQYAETVNPINGNIVSLMEDGTGNLWVATQRGVSIIDFKKGLVRLLNHAHGLSNDFVQSFTNNNGKIIISTNGGYNIIDPFKKTFEIVTKREGLLSDTIYNTFKDNFGNVWLTGPTNGVDLLDSARNEIRHLDVSGGLSDNNIQDTKQDSRGFIWLATNKRGVDIVDPKFETVKYLLGHPGLEDTCNRVLLIDDNDRAWIGTDKGIYIADTKNSTLTTITTREGLTDNKVLSLLKYKGSVVAGTGHKLTLITPPANAGDTWKIAPVQNSDGLIKQANSWASDAITSDGKYLWGDLALTVINEIKPASDSANTYITGMTVMTKPQNFINHPSGEKNDTLWKGHKIPVNAGYANSDGITWDSIMGPYNLPVNLELPYNRNYIQFQYAQAHLSRPDATKYCYILEGIDKNWSAVTNNSYTENYLNLPPGKYIFKVRSKTQNETWSIPAEMHFTITPPWYKTWWAYTLYFLFGLGILRAYIVYRSQMLKRENKLLEEKVALRTKQLEQSIEDLKATQSQLIHSEKMASLGELTAGIAHEIQNPLNFINNFSEVNTELINEMKAEIEKGNYEEVKLIAADIEANEQKINHHGKRADGIVKGMLQHSRTGNRQKEPTNINNLADEYLRLAYHGLRAKDKSFNAAMKTDFDETIGNINVISQDVGRVILNLITNAFYAVTQKKKLKPEGYEPTVTVSTKKTGSGIEIHVKDNGDGIPQRVLDKIFQPFFTTKPTGEGTGLGLSLSYDIIKAHNGELMVNTKEGEGAEFVIKLPANG